MTAKVSYAFGVIQSLMSWNFVMNEVICMLTHGEEIKRHLNCRKRHKTMLYSLSLALVVHFMS